MFQIKICGLTRACDVQTCIDAGADALGFNFYEPSPRYVSPKHAARLAEGAEHVHRVGVFVNAPAAAIADIASTVKLTCVQLHGDEPACAIAEVADACPSSIMVIRALRMAPGQGSELVEYLAQARAAGRPPDALLVDAAVPGAFGGSGQVAPWNELATWRTAFGDIPLILAGGLRAENVAAAIRCVAPDGVDAASGVETAPGEKDDQSVHAFVAAARKGFG